MSYLNQVKRIDIYQYYISTTTRLGMKNNESSSQGDSALDFRAKEKANVQQRENSSMLQDLAGKIDFTSSQTILEFNLRKKPRKDPHYRK
jgi:hypothetical protein